MQRFTGVVLDYIGLARDEDTDCEDNLKKEVALVLRIEGLLAGISLMYDEETPIAHVHGRTSASRTSSIPHGVLSHGTMATALRPRNTCCFQHPLIPRTRWWGGF